MTKDTHGTNDYWEGLENLTAFSFFLKPIHNIEPYRAITVVDVYRYVTGHYAQKQNRLYVPLNPPKKRSYTKPHTLIFVPSLEFSEKGTKGK